MTRLVSAALAVSLALVLVGSGAPAAPTNGWQRVEPGGKTKCARGGPFAFWTRGR